jgi:putative redox protein
MENKVEAKLTWKGRMSFDAVADSGHVIRIGTKPEYGGDDDGASPMEMVLMPGDQCPWRAG